MGEADCIRADVALEVDETLSGDFANLGGFDGMKAIAACDHARDAVHARGVSRVERGAVVPVLPVRGKELIHCVPQIESGA